MSFGDFGSTRSTRLDGSPDAYSSARNGDSEYIRLSNCVSSNIQQLTNKIASIQRIVNQIGTNADVPETFQNLQTLQKESNTIANETSLFLKQLRQIQSSPDDERQRKIQQDKLQENFSNALFKLQKVQRLAMEKERESVQRFRTQSTGQDPAFDDNESSPIRDENSSNNLNLQVQQQEDVNIEMIREREEALHQLESDIVNVNEIFKDLAIMVHEQGETIDSIEANVDHTQQHVEAANVQLSKARTHQSAARKKKCCLIVILLAVVIALALIIYFASK